MVRIEVGWASFVVETALNAGRNHPGAFYRNRGRFPPTGRVRFLLNAVITVTRRKSADMARDTQLLTHSQYRY